MTNRILVPLDGSALAEQAVPCAVALARALPAELVLFRAIGIPAEVLESLDESHVERQAVGAQLKADAEGYLGALIERLREAGLEASHALGCGSAADAILDYAEKEQIDQIVMATHGYGGLKRWTHGSVAERVLQSARVPLLLIRVQDPERAEMEQRLMLCRRILVPLDGSALAEHILPTVSTLARALGAELILFQVPISHVAGWMTGEWYLPVQGVLDTAEEDAQVYLENVAEGLKEQGLQVTIATGVGPVASSIIEYAEANQVDLIAMSTHGRTGLARWALGSVADRVLRSGSTPILLVRAE
jgi:nucleotide-binding universal stress UspA family protein